MHDLQFRPRRSSEIELCHLQLEGTTPVITGRAMSDCVSSGCATAT